MLINPSSLEGSIIQDAVKSSTILVYKQKSNEDWYSHEKLFKNVSYVKKNAVSFYFKFCTSQIFFPLT